MVKIIVGLDKDGNVIEDLSQAVLIRETEYDDEGHVINSIIYLKES